MTEPMEWADPPPEGRNRTLRFVEGLKSDPGRWAVYTRVKNGNVSSYRVRFPDVEWVVRQGVVYARWIGPT